MKLGIALAGQIVDLLCHKTPARVSVSQSRILGAGLGVFASTDIAKGAALLLYPGAFVPPVPLCEVGTTWGEPVLRRGEAQLFESRQNKDYVIRCCGGGLDGAGALASALAPHTTAHLVNHPPRGCSANVKPCDFYWTDVFGALGRYPTSAEVTAIPNFPAVGDFWYVSASGEAVFVPQYCDVGVAAQASSTSVGPAGHGGVKSLAPGEQTLKGNEGLLEAAVVSANLKACLPPLGGLVLVTTRPLLAGEELLFDYCLPRSSRPAWYHEPQKDQKSGLTKS